MSSVADRLRSGLDPNDSRWVVQRYFNDWQQSKHQGVHFDRRTQQLQLQSVAQLALHEHWRADAPITNASGDIFKIDEANHTLSVKRVCDETFKPVAGMNGPGFATGQLQHPRSIAIDHRDWVYIADTGNARVQVYDPKTGSVVSVVDEHLIEPSTVSIRRDGHFFIADSHTGMIHHYTADFSLIARFTLSTLDPWTEQPWTIQPTPNPKAIWLLGDNALAVFDPNKALLWHMSDCGEPLVALPYPAESALPNGWQSLSNSYHSDGEVILGPLDSGVYNTRWHRVLLDSNTPIGTHISVQTFASNEAADSPIRWAPVNPVPITQIDTKIGDEVDRLVHSDNLAWSRWTLGRLTRETPLIWETNTDGPVNSNRLRLPREVAALCMVGDRIKISQQSRSEHLTVLSAIDDHNIVVAGSGSDSVFNSAHTIELIQRDTMAASALPLDLSYRVSSNALAGIDARLDGHVETLLLPHSLAAFVHNGDVIQWRNDVGGARLEILQLPNSPITVTLNVPVAGDYQRCAVALVDTHNRLHVREALDDLYPVAAPASMMRIIDNTHIDIQPVRYIDSASQVVWLGPGAMQGDVTAQSWSNAEFLKPNRTDRGQFLWLKLRLSGKPQQDPNGVGPANLASQTPSVRSLRVLTARPSYTDWLPEIFSHSDARVNPPGAQFLERFLTLFEGQMTAMESALDSVTELLNPTAATQEWLDFIATWLDLSFDPSWPIAQRRQLVIEGASLQAARGTRTALARYLAIYTGQTPAITEGFQRNAAVPITLGGQGVLGVAQLGSSDEHAQTAEQFAHRFNVTLMLPSDRDPDAARRAVIHIIDTMKPAHTSYSLRTSNVGANRVGIDSQVDQIVIPGPKVFDPCDCNTHRRLTGRPVGHTTSGFRIGGVLGGYHGVSEVRREGG